MKALMQDRYGGPEVLEVREVDEPELEDDSVLVRVRATSVNPVDWHFMRGEPYIAHVVAGLRRPKNPTRGLDVSGVVERVGPEVTEFKPGDEVFGHRPRSMAELVVGKEEHFASKPERISFEQAGGIGVAGFTALQGLGDKGQIEPGQKVLITGASGGVGSFAVQIAKARGAEVTGVCSTPNVELVRSLGADHVIDYTREDFARSGKRYDVILYAAGTHEFAEIRPALAPEGTLLPIGSSKKTSNWVTPVGIFLKPKLTSKRWGSQNVVPYLANGTKDDLLALKKLIDDGKLTPVVDRVYPLSEAREAFAYQEQGHARGKVIITV
jgi:NADPH:quinone reductase-like Zn-dependent oxidoreductase